MAKNCLDNEGSSTCRTKELSDARNLPKEEVIRMIEHLALGFVTSVSKGEDPQLELVARSQKNVIRDSGGCLHLGKKKTIKRLFARNAAGAVKFAKIWQVLALIHKILVEGKAITQREGYYCLVNRFKNQSEFNATLQGRREKVQLWKEA